MEADEYILGTTKRWATLPASAPTREAADSHRSNKMLHTTKGDKMLTRYTNNKHMVEQTSRYIMQSTCLIILKNHVGGMAFIKLLQEITQGAGETPADNQVFCI